MSTGALSPRVFYTERVPAQWNRTLAEQEAAAGGEAAARALLDDMRGVDATVRIEVEGDGGGTFYLNVRRGAMSAEEAPADVPLLTVLQDRRAFERIASESGDSALGLLGGLSGLTGEFKLTKSRLENLRAISGCLGFEVTGANGFAFRVQFGGGSPSADPDTEIRVGSDLYADLLAGRIDPQDAFMSGRLDVRGDLEIAMQLALAALSPD